MSAINTFYEKKYAAGHSQKAPWDSVVSFVFRHQPEQIPREKVSILEVGCGTASNLNFAATEGFQVYGIDASASAINTAKKLFKNSNLRGNFVIGDFTTLPFDSGKFDLVIDRAGITCTGKTFARRAVDEAWRVLKHGGKFFFNPYSTAHTSSSSGEMSDDGSVKDIKEGTLSGLSGISFYAKSEIEKIFNAWAIHSLDHVVITDEHSTDKIVHAEWRVVAEKVRSALTTTAPHLHRGQSRSQ